MEEVQSLSIFGSKSGRRIYVNTFPNHKVYPYQPNRVKTSKYSLFTFLPKNIFEQFHGLANFYFLGIIILQFLPEFNQVGFIIPTIPLAVILVVTAIKDGVEDLRRHKADDTVNKSPTFTLENWINVNRAEIISDSSWIGKVDAFLLDTWSFISMKLKQSPLVISEILEAKTYITKIEEKSSLESQNKAKGDPLTANSRISRSSQVLNRNAWNSEQWQHLHVGDFILLRNNDRIPADVIVISTGEPDLTCYIETKNLDGETNLKIKRGIKEFQHIQTPDDCRKMNCIIDVEPPNSNLYSFNGVIHYENAMVPISQNHMLLRGCVLRNTSWLIAIVIYTGPDTKIMLNSGPTPSKRSKVDKQINPLIVFNVVTLCFLSIICATGSALYSNPFQFEVAMFSGIRSIHFQSGAAVAFITFFNCFIVFQNIIPVALYISLEVTKLAQSFLISQDIDLYDQDSDQSITPKSWNLCDDLGQIEYVFSDKTGTLTSNIMDFKKASIGGICYGKWMDPATTKEKDKKELEEERNIMLTRLAELFNPRFIDKKPGFIDSKLPLDIAEDSEQSKRIKGFFSVLAICHTVLVEKPEASNSDNILYRAQSPDEAALVTAAKNVGFACLNRNENNVEIDFMGTIRTYTILNILEFTSDRKRMSVIVLRPEGDILLMCKGADSVIYERIDKGESGSLLDITSEHLSSFANEGLRTLCLAYRRIPKEEYDEWNAKYCEAQSSIHDRDNKCNEIAELIEKDLILMGATAIEDKLQDGVPESIALLAKAGIKLWVLTGDKVETAINIGFSCNLLTKSMILIVIEACSPHDTLKQIREALQIFWDSNGQSVGGKTYALVIDGTSLKFALEYPCKPLLLELGCRCKAVLCCRVSPLQKALVVKLVREGLGAMCLAIGDGANDVSMIQEADIGIGISGKEGLQAVMASDYAISQFRFLSKLLLVHGRWAYIRSSELVLNYFYKNIAWLMIIFWFQFYCGFTAGLAIDYTFSIFFNTVFTFFPTMLVGIFDKDISASLSLKMPEIYLEGIRQKEFRVERFWIYMAHGVYQSLICYFGVMLMTDEIALGPNGFPADGASISVILASSSLIVINVFGTANWYTWSWINFFSLSASILMWILFLLIFCANSATSIFGLLPSLSMVLIIIIVITMSLLPRLIIKFTQRMISPNDLDILQECHQESCTVRAPFRILRSKDVLPKASGMSMNNFPSTPQSSPSKYTSADKNADGFEPLQLPEAHDLKMDALKNAMTVETEKCRSPSIGQVINDKVLRAGHFLKALLPERSLAPPYPIRKKGSIAYMGGAREMVENTGFAFSHDAGMQDVITPLQLALPAIPEEEGYSSNQIKRRRFPSLVPDRFRQFSKKAMQKLGKSKQSIESLSDRGFENTESPPSPSTTPPLLLPVKFEAPRKHIQNKRASFSSFSKQMFRKNASGARSHDNLRKIESIDNFEIIAHLDGKKIAETVSENEMGTMPEKQRAMSDIANTPTNSPPFTENQMLTQSPLRHSHPVLFSEEPVSSSGSDSTTSQGLSDPAKMEPEEESKNLNAANSNGMEHPDS